MASLVDKLDPRNINWQNSPHKVTPEIIAKNDVKVDELEKEQKLLESKLKRGVYKRTADFVQARKFQNRSFQRILDHRDRWDEIESTHPRVRKQREVEKDRFMDKAIAIQNKYDNVISEQAQKQGICEYLSKKTCSKGKDCYWFGKEDVAGKDVGCYSTKEPTIPIGQPITKRRSKKPNLPTLGEGEILVRTMGDPVALKSHLKSRLVQLHEQPIVETKEEEEEVARRGGRTRKKRRKRKSRRKKRKRKETLRRRKRKKTRKKTRKRRKR